MLVQRHCLGLRVFPRLELEGGSLPSLRDQQQGRLQTPAGRHRDLDVQGLHVRHGFRIHCGALGLPLARCCHDADEGLSSGA